MPAEEGFNGLALRAIPAPGSEFGGWVLEGEVANETLGPEVDCESTPNCFAYVPPGVGRGATAVFCTTGTAQGWGELCKPATPTLLKVTRIGEGTVVSSPAGIECGGTCEHEFEIGELVTLTASPASG